MKRLRNLDRKVLVGLVVALLAIEAGLIWAGWRALQQPQMAAVMHEIQTPIASPPAPSTSAARPTSEVVETPVVEPVVRSAGPLVAAGDMAGVALLFDVEEAMTFVETLTVPEWGGRQGGSPGGAAAAEYIAEKFQEYGLRPAGTEGYFQPFSLPYAEILGLPTFVITTTAGTVYDDFTYSEDFRFAWGGYSGGGVADGQVFWVNEGQAGDYDGLDVNGGVVFCRYSGGDEVTRQAVEHGASGLIVLVETERQIASLRTYREPAYLPESLPTLLISEEVAEALLDGSGYSVQDLSILYRSAPLSTVSRFEIFLDEPGEAMGRNVLGVLPGADPELRDEVVVVGGHYDHVGTDANGDIYYGANDNASGVAVILEIARNWQMAGFTPGRTVLFAAWDGEEQGLLGSIHYVEHPRYPLTSTVAMFQLDMVGLASDGMMTIDGYDTLVGRQLQASARLIDVPTRKSVMQGRSDHAPFQAVRIPAVLLIWDDAEVPYYHTPQDTPDTLHPDRLREVGIMTSHAAVVLLSMAPGLEKLLVAQAQTVIAGDVEAYVTTLNPEDEELIRTGREWLTSRPVEARQAYTITVGAMEVMDDTALVDVKVSTVDVEGRRIVMSSSPVRLVRRGSTWHTTWPVADIVATTHIVARFVSPGRGNDLWAQSLDETYARVAPVLGLGEAQPITVTVYPNERALEWLAGPGEDQTRSPVPGVHVVRTNTLTPTVVGLILDQIGLPHDQGDWLRVGLGEWVNTLDDPEAQREQTKDLMSTLQIGVSAREVMTGSVSAFGSADIVIAESMAGHLMETQGTDGLRRLCEAWGETGTQGGALVALSTSLQGFADIWEATVVDPALAVEEGIRATLDQRETAVLSGDKVAFLETVVPDDPVFLAEEGNWFDYLTERPVQEYTLGAEVLRWEGESALARLVMTAGLAERVEAIRTVYDARFRRIDDRWLLAGPDWETLEGEHIAVRYTDVPTETAEVMLETAELACARLSADLQHEPASRTEIKLYDGDDVFRASVLPPVPSWMLSWYEPGGAIKLSPRIPVSELVEMVARGLSHQALHSLGVELEWLQEGVAALESMRAFPDQTSSLKSRYVPVVREALRRHNLYDWANMPEIAEIDEEELDLLRGQSWMLVEELVREFGMDTLNRLIRSVADGRSFEDAFAVATGTSFSEWEPVWEEVVRSGGVPAEWIEVARGFDPERVLETVRHLASPEYAGRRAGSDQAEEVALWIADQMVAYRLEPGASDDTFFQALSLPYAELTAMPTLDILNSETGETLSLPYRETFREVVGGPAGGGQVDAELVWLPRGFHEGMHLGGRVAIKKLDGDPVSEARNAHKHGAGGLVLIKRYPKMRERVIRTPELGSATLPVVEIAEAIWSDILQLAGITAIEANQSPPALMMSLRCQLSVPYEPARSATALNVIGVLPGTQPQGRPLVVAANYDGVGSLPDGTLYPGANKNAAGVAVMLEVARLWEQSGYVPDRPIYFVAWGAEESELASSHYYAWHPVVSPERILGLLELDTVGASMSYYLNLDWETRSTADPLFVRQSVGSREGYYAVEQRARERELLFNLELAGELLDRRLSRGRAKEESTHELFRGMGVPSVLLFWPRASDIHTPEDAPDTLDAYKLATTGEVVMLTTLMVTR